MLFIVTYIIAYYFLKTSRQKSLLKARQDFQNKLEENEEIAYVSDYHFGTLEMGALIPSILLVCIACCLKSNIWFCLWLLLILVISLYYIKDAPKYNIFIITNRRIYPYFYNKQLYNRMKNNYQKLLHGFCEPIPFEEIEYVESTFFNLLTYGIQINLKNNVNNINGFCTNKNKEIAEYINSQIKNSDK